MVAAVVSGAAEADFDLGMRVNLEGTRLVLERCRQCARPPRVVFSRDEESLARRKPPCSFCDYAAICVPPGLSDEEVTP